MHHFRKKSSSSSTPTNSPPSTPAPPIVEYIKQELATFHPRAKDLRALAASSSAIALSIASPSCDPTDKTPDESGSSTESVWRTAYGAARMAVEIANASSDMFLPLKAVVGTLSVLINNYDKTTANRDQIREIEERIRSLCGILKYPADDQDSEERARREALRRKLAGIIAKLKPLSEHNGIVKFLNNVDYANTLSGFVQDLAYAVTDYQTSLQQSIHKNTKGIGETANRVDETTKRIDETTKKIDQSAQNIIEATDIELLGKLNPVCNAGYQAGHHYTCLRGTRKSVLDGIMRWAKDPQDRPVFWLNGLAGTGKSTIAQTFSETIAKTGILGASFFCSRDYLDRRELKNIFPTLAHQLARPVRGTNSLISQLRDLIVDPLSSTNISCVIVIDALDECVDDQPASAILSVLGRYVKQLTFAKFFITGRPEPRIRTGFRLPLLEPLTQIFLLHEVKLSDVDGDIRLYLQEKLIGAAKRRSNFDLSNPWPCDNDLVALTDKSSGLFIFASTLVRFIESEFHEPNERLQLIVTPSDSTVHEGQAGIDPLYTQVLTLAFSGIKEATVFTNLRRVLGAVILAFNPLSREQIAKILGINPFLITTNLRHLHSVLLVPSEESKEIRVFHKSFPDFLQDRDRCSDPNFFIDSPVHHGDIALNCLELLKKLKPNPCDLPDFVMNRDVANLPELLEGKVGSGTRYACGYWAMHIRSSPTTGDYAIRLISSIAKLFEKNIVPWIEVMSLENRLESVIHTIYTLFDWLGMVDIPVSDLRGLVEDTLRFTMHFFHLIQQSALHIYHSALPLSPRSSTFRSRTLSEKTKIKGFYGRSDAWGIVVRTITKSSKHSTCMATFGYKIAAARDDGTVDIYDSVTGVLRLSLRLADPALTMRGSPDGSILFCAHNTPSITAWDMQTGGLIHTFHFESNAEDIDISLKGRYLACGLSGGSVEVRDIADKMEGAVIWTRSPVTRFCWLEPEGQLVVSTGTSVHIYDVVAGTVLRKYTIRYPAHCMVYSQTFDQLAIMSISAPQIAITTINNQTGTVSTSDWTRKKIRCFAFSQTTKELVCGMETRGLWLFNFSTGDSKHIDYQDAMTSVSSLKNGIVVANSAGSGIQLLSPVGGHPPTQPTIHALTVEAFDEGRIIATFPTSRDSIILLDSNTMSPLLKIPAQKTRLAPTHHTTILCASHEKLMAVYCFKEVNTGFMQLWGFREEVPRWTVEIDGVLEIGRFSPSAVWLLTIHTVGHLSRFCVWNPRDGQLFKQLERTPLTRPLDVKFTRDTEFWLHHGGNHTCYYISERNQEITVGNYQPQPKQTRKKQYSVNNTSEWVISGSERICWIPPGCIGSTQPNYCWVGHSLVMVGQDGMLRKLSLLQPS